MKTFDFKPKSAIRLLGILVCAALLNYSAGTGLEAGNGIEDQIAKLLANLQANGEYILGSHYQADETNGKVVIVIETTDGSKTYDESGQIVDSTDRQGNKTIYADGIPVKTLSPSGQVVSQTNINREAGTGAMWLESQDYMGNRERRRVDAKGQLQERIDQQGNVFRYQSLSNARGQTVGIVEVNQRDGSRTTRFIDPETGDVTRILDPSGALILVQDHKDERGRKVKSLEMNTKTGLLTEKQFDELGRETRVISSDGIDKSIAYEVDNQGHIIASTEAIRETSPSGKTESYQVRKTFDEANRVTSETDSRGKTITYDYTLKDDGQVAQVEERETLVNEQGKKIINQRTRILGEDGRVKTLFENGHRTDYEYTVGENGIIQSVKETKYIAESMQKLHTQITENDERGYPRRSEKWEELGAIGKRHSTTEYVVDPLTGKVKKTTEVNDLGDITETTMDEKGLPISNETWETHGARLKRHSLTKVKTDSLSGHPQSTETVNDLGDKTVTTMDEYGLPVKSETWNARGALLKRHSITQIQTNRLTGKPEKTVSVNDRGDVTITYMDAQGLPLSSESQETYGAMLGRQKTTEIQTDPHTGVTRSTRTRDGLRAAVTLMDLNGLAVSSESWDTYGAELKRHSTSQITSDEETGEVKQTESVNDRGDETTTLMDANGLAVSSESWKALGATLKRHDQTKITTDQETGMTTSTESINDLEDYTKTEMDENGLAVSSLSRSALGAIKKRASLTQIETSLETGLTVATDSLNGLGDRTLTKMDENGLSISSEAWNALGAKDKRHSRTDITTDGKTGETSMTKNINDRGDQTRTFMDENGLAYRSEGQLALGANLKKQSVTSIHTNPDTGLAQQTKNENDRGDQTLTLMDENGLATLSKNQLALGAILKRTSVASISTNPYTGETDQSLSGNERGDKTLTAMDKNGLAMLSKNRMAFGARLKRNSATQITTNPDTGETAATQNINDRGDASQTLMDRDGLAVGSKSQLVFGATQKRNSVTQITTDKDTGETAETFSTNDRGDETQSFMDANGLARSSESWLSHGAKLKRHSVTGITTNPYTGETAGTFSVNDRADQTMTVMDENGLAVASESWLALGAILKRHSLTRITTNQDTGETDETFSVNDRGDTTFTEMDDDGLAEKSESQLALGAIQKRHSVTKIDTDRATGETKGTNSRNDRGDTTATQMDNDGLAVKSQSQLALGAKLKRQSVTAINTDKNTGETTSTDSLNDRGDRTQSWMNKHGLAENSEGWLALGANLKKHSQTEITTDPNTGETAATASVNDRGDQTQTVMDENGLAVQSEANLALGANLKKHSVTNISTDPYTGETAETFSGNDRGDQTLTQMDENGLAILSKSQLALGAILKRTSTTDITTNQDTGETDRTHSKNLRGDTTYTEMEKNGLATMSKSQLTHGAILKRNNRTQITTNPDTGETDKTSSINDRGDATHTVMDQNGLAVGSTSQLALGATLKRNSATRITTNPDTGETSETFSTNDRGDETQSWMDSHGLAVSSESWLAQGAKLKRHSITGITTNPYTGETSGSFSVNDRGDRTLTAMDGNGLAVASESWLALGAEMKRHSFSQITTNQDTGETAETFTVNDRQDKTQTWMDDDGLAEKSESWLALGAILKRHSVSKINTDQATGETNDTSSINDRGDTTFTEMDNDGLAVKSKSQLALGARLKRTVTTDIRTNENTGETDSTLSLNNRGDKTLTQMNIHGLAEKSEGWLAYGANLKKHNLTDIWTGRTGETERTFSVNDRGDETDTLMDINGLAIGSHAKLALGAERKRTVDTTIHTNQETGETDSTESENGRGDQTLTLMTEDGLAYLSKSVLAYGAIAKRTSTTQIVYDWDTGETQETLSLNQRGDYTLTQMDRDGLAERSKSLLALGAWLKRTSWTQITTDQDSGETRKTESVNELGDHTSTNMDENGLATDSTMEKFLGAENKKYVNTRITVDQATGETSNTYSINRQHDETWTEMNRDGLATSSHAENTFGATDKSVIDTRISTNEYSGETDRTYSVNRLGDQTWTEMSADGLAYWSRAENRLGADNKRYVETGITTDQNTGETASTYSVNRQGDQTWTQMDENGLSFQSHVINALGVPGKRESWSEINTNQQTGMTDSTLSINAIFDQTMTLMNEHGLAYWSHTLNTYGAGGKKEIWTDIDTNPRTGMTDATYSINRLGDQTWTWMDQDGLAYQSRAENVYGAGGKRFITTDINTNPETGMTDNTFSQNALADKTWTWMNADGMAYQTRALNTYGANGTSESWSDITPWNWTGITRETYTWNKLGDKTWTEMNQDGLAYSSFSVKALGATDKKVSWAEIDTNQWTGITGHTYSINQLGDRTWTDMDENGLAVRSYAHNALGAEEKKHMWTDIYVRDWTGMTARTFSENGSRDKTWTWMDEDGLAFKSRSQQARGAWDKRFNWTDIDTNENTGLTRSTYSFNRLGDETWTTMDGNGLARQSRGINALGAENKKYTTTTITPNQRTGLTRSTYSVNRQGDETWTSMDRNGLAVHSLSHDQLGPNDGKIKNTRIVNNQETGLTQHTLSWDALHIGAVETTMDNDGLAIRSYGTDRYGPLAGRSKRTFLIPNRRTGIAQESRTYDGLHDAGYPTRTLMNDDGLAVESWSKGRYGPPSALYQYTLMEPDPDTGLTSSSQSETRSSPNGGWISRTTTQNHPTRGTPVSSISENRYGAYRVRTTAYATDPDTGLILRSTLTDDGGTTNNWHDQFGITRSVRRNLLGAIKTLTTTNVINTNTGVIRQSLSVDRKGQSLSRYNNQGMVTVSTRTNLGAHYTPSETTTVQTWNPYTGGQRYSLGQDRMGRTSKWYDLNGFLTKNVRVDKWGSRTTTDYSNNQDTGMPIHSLGQGSTGTTETWYEMNGLSLLSKFTARIGLHSTTKFFYDTRLDMASSESVDERGNVSVSIFNRAGEATHVYSKNGTTVNDLYNSRAKSSSGPAGSTTYTYSGRWLDKTVSRNNKGETTTSWMDHRENGAARRVHTKDGTTTYNNRYNSRGFVTYRTESNGSDSGFSRFNNYGDQEYTEWSGSIAAGKMNYYEYDGKKYKQYQAQRGSWKSKTTYRNNSRGDVQSWTTTTTSQVPVRYYEIKIDDQVVQEAKTETIRDSETKTESPDYTLKTARWVRSHLRGGQPPQRVLASGVNRNVADISNTETQSQGDEEADLLASALLPEDPPDATEPGYASYQKKLAIARLQNKLAERMQQRFKPVVERIQEDLQAYIKTGDLNMLRRVVDYNLDDMQAFDEGLRKASKKDVYFAEQLRASYYKFTGEQLDVGELFSQQSLHQALNLTGLPAQTGTLQNWVKFTASSEEESEILAQLRLVRQKLEGGSGQAEESKLLSALWESLTETLRQLAAEKLGVKMSSKTIHSWLAETLPSAGSVAQLVDQFDGKQATQSAGQTGQGVVLGGGLGTAGASSVKGRLDQERLGGQQLGVAAAAAIAGKTTSPEQAAKLGEPTGKPAKRQAAVRQAVRGFEDIVHVHRLRLQNEQQELGKQTRDRKGNVQQILREDGARKTFAYASGSRTEVKSFTAAGQLDSTAEYREGWLQQVSFSDGAEINITYTMKRGKTPKTVNVHVKKGEEERIYKYDGQGKLQSVLAKDGNRMTVIEQPEEEEPLSELLDALQDSGIGKPGDRFESEKVKEQPRLQE